MTKGKALDLAQSSTIENFNANMSGSSNYREMKGADVVIVTAGFQRRPGMTRDDLFEAMKHDGLRPKIVKVDGGMVMNNWFSQFLSDIVNVKVLRPKVQETTALGAAFMAGLQIGVYKSLKDISKNWHLDKKFSPKMKNTLRNKLLKGWSAAIKKTLSN